MRRKEAATYDSYLRIHKRFVGPKTAEKLTGMHSELSGTNNPGYSLAAGWAAIEAAVVGSQFSLDERHGLIESASKTWRSGQKLQRISHEKKGISERKQSIDTNRWRMHTAFLPLFHDMLDGNVKPETLDGIHKDLLVAATSNVDALHQGLERGDQYTINNATGLGFELNGLCVVSRLKSPTLVAISAMARSDNGVYHPRQTHDMSLLRLKWGAMEHATPMEVKTSKRPRGRYEAALVRGRIHLVFDDSEDALAEVVSALAQEESTGVPDRSLNELSETILHLGRHHRLKDGMAKQCLGPALCDVLPRRRLLPALA